jgi:diketogulonate reductase-like aldo/keto reductase
MQKVTFPDGRTVAPVGMGSWRLGQGRYPASDEEDALRLGLDLGMDLIDTAEMYGDGRSESLIGRAIQGRRDTVYLVSKVLPTNANRTKLERACEASLQRLGTDYLDLYLLHWRSGSVLSEAVEGLEKLKRAGKIRAWGVSNLDTDDMEELFDLDANKHCATNQVLYNLESRGTEFDLQPLLAEHKIPVMAYSPLGGHGGALLHETVLGELATKHHASPAAVALAWTIRAGKVIAIPEAGADSHIRENVLAMTLAAKLDTEDLAALDAAFPPPRRAEPLDIR